MLKKFLCILSILTILPVYSASSDNILTSNEKVVLYLYTKECGYCVKFDPIYNNVSKKYGNNCKFLKIDANSKYGRDLMRGFYAVYVPYVVIIDNSKRTAKSVNPDCLLNQACMQNVIEKFIN